MTRRGPRLGLFVEDSEVETVTLALNYVCNSRCRFCFIERELDLRLPDTPDAYVTRVFLEHARRPRYDRIILSGAEATLRADLPAIARRARSEGRFAHVRLQTNGRRLANRAYLDELIEAGIDEYFISVHAGTADLDAVLTRNPRSFFEMRNGLANCIAAGVRTISNTCVTSRNHGDLDALASFLIDEGVPESRFWAFIEFGDIGQAAEHVRFGEAVPNVLAAVERLREAERLVELQWFPKCLLGTHQHLLRNRRDDTLIHEEFTKRSHAHGAFSCPHQERCPAFGQSCLGLHERYVALFGDERQLLTSLA